MIRNNRRNKRKNLIVARFIKTHIFCSMNSIAQRFKIIATKWHFTWSSQIYTLNFNDLLAPIFLVWWLPVTYSKDIIPNTNHDMNPWWQKRFSQSKTKKYIFCNLFTLRKSPCTIFLKSNRKDELTQFHFVKQKIIWIMSVLMGSCVRT